MNSSLWVVSSMRIMGTTRCSWAWNVGGGMGWILWRSARRESRGGHCHRWCLLQVWLIWRRVNMWSNMGGHLLLCFNLCMCLKWWMSRKLLVLQSRCRSLWQLRNCRNWRGLCLCWDNCGCHVSLECHGLLTGSFNNLLHLCSWRQQQGHLNSLQAGSCFLHGQSCILIRAIQK